MLPDRVSNPGPLTYVSGALPIALHGPAPVICNFGYPRAWEVPGTAGLKYRDFVWKLRCPSSV